MTELRHASLLVHALDDPADVHEPDALLYNIADDTVPFVGFSLVNEDVSRLRVVRADLTAHILYDSTRLLKRTHSDPFDKVFTTGSGEIHPET